MSWGAPGAAGALVDSAGRVWGEFPPGVTGSLVVERADLSVVARRFSVIGFGGTKWFNWDVMNTADDPEAYDSPRAVVITPTGTSPVEGATGVDPSASDTNAWLCYLDSGIDFIFEVDIGNTTTANQFLYQTFIPLQKVVSTWAYSTDGLATDPTGGSSGRCDFQVYYSHPSIVTLPEGRGWLLLLQRIRVWRDSTSGDFPETAGDGFTPNQCFGDTVAYWQPDTTVSSGGADAPASFTTSSVIGPLLMVDGYQSVSAGQDCRLWVGTGSGAVATDPSSGQQYLYLYYDVEVPGDGIVDAAAVDALGSRYLSDGSGSTCVKRILIDDLFDVLDAAVLSRTAESAWTGVDAIGGDLLGPVRVFQAYGFGRARLFRERLNAAIGRDFAFPATDTSWDVKIVDPEIRVTNLGQPNEVLSLFFTVLGRGKEDPMDGDHGHGFWRAAALRAEDSDRAPLLTLSSFSPMSTSPPFGPIPVLTDRPVGFVYGVDFIVARTDPTTGSPDQVSATNIVIETAGRYNAADSDPIEVTDGTMRVFSGGGLRVSNAGGAPTDVAALFEGNDPDTASGDMAPGSAAWTR